MSSREVILMQFLMTFAFYSTSYLVRPWRIVPMMLRMLTGKEETQLDQFVRTKRKQFLNSQKWLGKLLTRPGVPAKLPELKIVDILPEIDDVPANQDRMPAPH